jgi:hypothetical protein
MKKLVLAVFLAGFSLSPIACEEKKSSAAAPPVAPGPGAGKEMKEPTPPKAAE